MTRIPTMPEHGSVRFRQAAAVMVLRDLLMRDLPALQWHVSPYSSLPDLTGQVPTTDNAESRRVLAAWAEFLGAEVKTTRHERYTLAEIRTVREGVDIRIYDHLDQAYTYVEVATGGAPDDCVHDCDEINCSNDECFSCRCCGVPEAKGGVR